MWVPVNAVTSTFLTYLKQRYQQQTDLEPAENDSASFYAGSQNRNRLLKEIEPASTLKLFGRKWPCPVAVYHRFVERHERISVIASTFLL